MLQFIPIFEDVLAHLCMIQSKGELDTDVVDECAIPNYKGPAEFDTPECAVPQLDSILKDFKVIFWVKPVKLITTFTH